MARELHNFDGNEVIATDLPQYLNQNFTSIPSNMGVWDKNEEVEVGDIRFLSGRENTGYILECVSSGTTGETQPVIIEEDVNLVANYTDSGVVGRMRLIFNSAEKDVDEVFATGVVYGRSSYPELWEYAQLRAGLLIDEEEWQAKFIETNGKFVPYYSRGDGSTTFRTPLLGGYIKGAETSGEFGNYKEAGLPSINHTHTRGTMEITGTFSSVKQLNTNYTFSTTTGAFSSLGQYGAANSIRGSEGATTYQALAGFNASKSWTGATSTNSNVSQVYGNSDTVTPETMVGIWVIKAIGVIIDQGSTDLQDILNGVNDTQDRITNVEKSYLPLSGGTMNGSIEIATNQALAKNKSDNKDFVRILGGTSTNDGARISLAPTYHETMPGEFWLVTGTIDGKNASLIGRPNGSLTWGGKNVIADISTSIGGASTTKPAVVTSTYRSGTTWYRVWSDKWVEQGGQVGGDSSTGNNWTAYTVTFSKPFADTNYIITGNGNSSTNTGDFRVTAKTTTTATVAAVSVYPAVQRVVWVARGLGA